MCCQDFFEDQAQNWWSVELNEDHLLNESLRSPRESTLGPRRRCMCLCVTYYAGTNVTLFWSVMIKNVLILIGWSFLVERELLGPPRCSRWGCSDDIGRSPELAFHIFSNVKAPSHAAPLHRVKKKVPWPVLKPLIPESFRCQMKSQSW